MQSFARVIVLFGECLRAPIEERDADGTRRMIGGKGNTRHAARRRRKSTAGQHLHAPVPEALAFDRMRRNVPRSGRLHADDFVSLSRGRAAEALAWTKVVMTKLGLTINEAKTSLRNRQQALHPANRERL